jgi:membrane protease YdiL (CAAX protease family)
MARTLRITPRAALAVVIVVLGLLNVVDIRVARASLIVGPVVVAGLTGIAGLAGLSWQDLGLGPGTWRPGLRWAAVEIAIVGLVLAAAAALPLTREAFRDTRYRLDLGNTLLTSLVLIPIGTVLVEELAFRGVLWGCSERSRAPRRRP